MCIIIANPQLCTYVAGVAFGFDTHLSIYCCISGLHARWKYDRMQSIDVHWQNEETCYTSDVQYIFAQVHRPQVHRPCNIYATFHKVKYEHFTI